MTAPKKDSDWFTKLCQEGCQICGTKLSGDNNGLEWSHIISQKDNGKHEEINCLALCPNCAYAFDYVVKPAIFKATEEYTDNQVPVRWKNAEGRLKPEIVDK